MSGAYRSRPIAMRFILRTLKRLVRIAWRVDAERLAGELVRHGLSTHYVKFPHDYLGDVFEYMEKLMPKRTFVCAGCGKEHAYEPRRRYCGKRCRQRAYRKRIACHARTAIRNKRPKMTDSCSSSESYPSQPSNCLHAKSGCINSPSSASI